MFRFDNIQAADVSTWLLEAVPHRSPFRFVDEILELDERHILGSYRYREDEFFYSGHFPGCPVTPGVILLETMVQIGGLAFGIFLNRTAADAQSVTMPILTGVDDAEFFAPVHPGERVFILGEKRYFRNHHLKIEASMTAETGQEICSAVLSGIVGKEK